MQIILEFSKFSGVPTFLFHWSSLMVAMSPLPTPVRVLSKGQWFPSSGSSLSCLCTLVILDLVHLKGETSGVLVSCSTAQCLPIGRAEGVFSLFPWWYPFLKGEICRLMIHHFPHSYCIFPVRVCKIHAACLLENSVFPKQLKKMGRLYNWNRIKNISIA